MVKKVVMEKITIHVKKRGQTTEYYMKNALFFYIKKVGRERAKTSTNKKKVAESAIRMTLSCLGYDPEFVPAPESKSKSKK